MISGNPCFSIYIVKAVAQFSESQSKGSRLVAKVARYTLQLDSAQGPNQVTMVAMKLTAEIFDNRG